MGTGPLTPLEDQEVFLKAQLIFWLIGATDGHAKNFSVFLGPGGSYHMTPIYDVLPAQPAMNARQIERKQMKMAMSVGKNRHYRFDQIHLRHFVQTAMRAGISEKRALSLIEDIAERAPAALEPAAEAMPVNSSSGLNESINAGVHGRLRRLIFTISSNN